MGPTSQLCRRRLADPALVGKVCRSCGYYKTVFGKPARVAHAKDCAAQRVLAQLLRGFPFNFTTEPVAP